MTTYAIDTHAGDGSTVAFEVTYDFISRDDVSVFRVVDSTAVSTTLTVITSGAPTGNEFIWDSDTQITVGTAPAVGETLRIIRNTPEAQQIVRWQNGSYIIAEDLNEADLQFLYNIQELYDIVTNLDGTVTGEAVKKVLGTAPVQVNSTNDQEPVVSVDETVSTDNPNSLTSDTKLMSELAIDNAFKQHVGTTPATGNKLGQIRIDNVATPQAAYWWNGTSWVALITEGQKGDKGDTGPAPGLQSPPATATNVANKADGSVGDATAAVSQDAQSDLQFQFGIPVGEKGDKGDTGPKGDPGDGVTYKGQIDATTAAEPSNPSNGDFYINTVTGTSSWTGLSAVTDGSRLIYNYGTSQWDEFTPASATDLGYNDSTTNGVITNTNGSDATIPVVDNTNGSEKAGLMTPQMLTNLTAAGNDPTLSAVLTAGNTSETNIVISESGTSTTISPGAITAHTAIDLTNDSNTGVFLSRSNPSITAHGDSGFIRLTNGDQSTEYFNADSTETIVGDPTATGGTGVTLGVNGTGVFTSDVTLQNGSALQLNNSANSFFVKHRAKAGLGASATYTWKAAPGSGTNGILESDDSGSLTWRDSSTFIRTTGDQTLAGKKTFSDKLVFNGGNHLTNRGNTDPPSGKANDQGIWLTSNTVIGVGNSNEGGKFGNTNNSTGWTKVVTFINGASANCGKIECKKDAEPRFAATSDRRLKSDIVEAESMLEKFEAIRVCRFTKTSPDELPTENVLGFIADELQQVFPDAVDGEPEATVTMGNVVDSNGNIIDTDVEDPATSGYVVGEGQIFVASRTEVPKYQTVAESALTVPMAKAIQELIAQNKALAARLDALEGA